MPVASNFTSVYSQEWEINFMQCMPNGYLRYTDLCNILQLTAASHSELGGFSFVDMQLYNQAWVLSRMRLEILELPKWKDRITVTTWINSLENSRSIRAMEVTCNGKKHIGAETNWAVFNTITRRPEAMILPHEHCQKYPDRRATDIPVSVIKLPQKSIELLTRKVVLSDLDLVNHVNNMKYLEWCIDLCDEQKILSRQLSAVDMNFMRELSLGDLIECHESNSEKQSIYTMSKDNKIVFALSLHWK